MKRFLPKSFLVLAFLYAFNTHALPKTEKPGDKDSMPKAYSSPQGEGLIGVTEESPVDNPADNIFHVEIKTDFNSTDKVWLVYDLEGVQDHTSVSRSINDQIAVGGYLVKKRNGWTTQREQINAEWLTMGDNVIRFTLPENAMHSYRIKNLRLEVEPSQQDEQDKLILNQPSLNYFFDKAYVKGFITGEHKNVRVRIAGKEARVFNGEFESIIDFTEAQSSCFVEAELIHPDGTTSCQSIKFSEPNREDFSYSLDQYTYRAEKFFSVKGNESVSLHGASLTCSDKALSSGKILSITSLRAIDIPSLDAGMVNVTKDHAGFRFLPHGTVFNKDVQLIIPFEATLIPDGYTEKDIRTYYFDEQSHHWVPVSLDTVLNETAEVVSRTLHFTDYINAIIKVPESPEVEAYNSTSMKGIKAANPTAGINLINPPQPNNTGSAALSYPINIPAGRAGMQPQLSVAYNSGGGNGWMGMGWNLTIPAISIDTRWGVPRYDPDKETETYNFNGEQLSPVAHRTTLENRSNDKQFYPRVEGAFNRIKRYGDSPANYWWVITDKSGTKYIYGGSGAGNGAFDKDAVLRTNEGATSENEKGNVAQWYLREVRDLNGNTVKYHYIKVPDTGVSDPSASKGYQIYIDRITYTGYQGGDGLYSVLFMRESGRADKIIAANLGFKQVTGDLLKKIVVRFDGKDIRSYQFGYKSGAFLKTLLTDIQEFDSENKLFNTHSFEYYDDINAKDGYTPFFGSERWDTQHDDITGGFLNKGLNFNDKASALSGTQSRTIGGGLAVTVGPPGSLVSKSNTAGISYNYSNTKSEGRALMLDINGDGLPDKVMMFKIGRNKSIQYRPQLRNADGSTAFGGLRPVNGISEFLKEVNSSNDFGIESNFGIFAGVNHTISKSTTSVYFTEANGDGLIDLVRDGKVLFNRLDSNGDPTFFDNSSGTPNPVSEGAGLDGSVVNVDQNEIQQLKDQNPLQDMVRMWRAPYDGNVRITAPVTLIEDLSEDRQSYTTADGVRVSIELKGNELWKDVIKANEYNTRTPSGLTNISVKKNDRIFFRVHSIEDGSYDKVTWSPVVEYTQHHDTLRDANQKHLYRFDSHEDYLMSTSALFEAPIKGKIKIDGVFTKPITTDSVIVEVLLKRGNTVTVLYEIKHKDDTLVTHPVQAETIVEPDDKIAFNVRTTSNIDWTEIKWRPYLYYTESHDPLYPEVKDEDGKYLIQTYPVPTFSIFADVISRSEEWMSPVTDSITVTPEFTLLPETELFKRIKDGDVYFTIKRADTLVAKYKLKVINGLVSQPSPAIKKIYAKKGDKLYFEYHTTERTIAYNIVTSRATIALPNESKVVQAGVHTVINPSTDFFGPMYRQWGFFSYNGNAPYGNQLIDESKLNLDNLSNDEPPSIDLSNSSSGEEMEGTFESSGGHRADKNVFALMYADGTISRWVGNDDLAFISIDTLSSSRMGIDQISSLLPELSQDGGRGFAIDKITKSNTTGLAVSAAVGVNGSSGNSRVVTDFLDMNGDRYPDILGEYKIQYTLPQGGFESTSKSHAWEFGHRTKLLAGGLTAGGDFAGSGKQAGGSPRNAKFAALGEASGFSVGAVWSDDKAEYSWMDINGDGLPDRVNVTDQKVNLNLGYSFAPAESWGSLTVRHGSSLSTSGGLSINIKNKSIQAGVGYSRSDNFTHEAMQDVNGDGLVDRLVLDAEDVLAAKQVIVYFNTGSGFSGTPVVWKGIDRFSKGVSTTFSANAAFTFGIPLVPPTVVARICFNPKVQFSQGFNREKIQLSDVDGDGFPDYVTSDEDKEMNVMRSTIGRTNMLREVKRPLGASFTMNYHKIGNTYEMSNSTWVLDTVKVFDGYAGDGVDNTLTTYAYEGGVYDRREREFYGFGKVISRTHDTGKEANPIYTQVTQIFENKDYFKKGLIISELTTDGAGNKFIEKTNSYEVKDIAVDVKFPALIASDQKFYEGQSTAGKSTQTSFQYDAIGNVITYIDKGDDGAEDDLHATITYHDLDNLYVKGAASTIEVKNGSKVYRKREAVIDTNTGDIKQIRQFLSDTEVAVHDIEYDEFGNLKKITRPPNGKGQRLSFDYEYDGVTHTYPVKVSNSYGYSSETTFDLSFGQKLTSKDLNGNEIKYELDKAGRVISITGPYEKGGANKTIEFEYHHKDGIPWALTKHFDPSNPKNKLNTVTFVDGLGRVLQTKKDVALYTGDGKADAEMMAVSGRVFFDAFGRTTTAHYPKTASADPIVLGDFIEEADDVKPTTTFYDVLNRVVSVILPDNTETKTEFGFGNDRYGKKQFNTKTIDANGKQTEQFTDIRGRTTSVKSYTSDKEVWTSFKYNAMNEQIEAVDDLGHTTFSVYDNLGRRIERNHPDAGSTNYTYDLAGNLKELVTANLAKEGLAILYSYDFERLIETSYPQNPENNVRYTYGEAGASDNRAGRIILQEDASGAQEFFYGPLGEVVKNIRTIVIPQHDEQTYVTEWTYDTWNRLTSMVYPDGEKVEYTYNAGGLLRSMTGKKKNATFAYVNQLGYDKFEQRVFLAYGNGTKTTYNYEPDGRKLKNMTAKTSANRLFMDNVYGYDKVNNVVSLENKAPVPSPNLMGGSSQYTYEYDDLYRLTSAQGSYTGSNEQHSYTLSMNYNSVGSITQKNQVHKKKDQEQKKSTYNLTYTYGETQPHAPIHIGEQSYTYDANGNQTGWTDDVSGQRRVIHWDEENRIRAIYDNGALHHYIYDASGERVLKGKSTGQRVFVNGQWKAGSGQMGNYTVYVNPYIVLKSGGYTKHYYIEGQRIVSKLGGGWDNNGQGPLKAGGNKVDYSSKGQKVFDGIVKNLKFLGTDGQILTAGKSGKVPPGQITGTSNTAETFRYFYHPDHLGSTSYVTDASGEVFQHLEYFAFGETFVEEHSNTDRTPFLFNGKELDEETGLYYYGARYYDARTSVWQSVDPKAEKYSGWNPYAYILNNPINFIDPDGMQGTPPRHHAFFSGSGMEIYKAARANGASVQGSLLVLAQASLESGYGRSSPASKHNNFFGLMGGGSGIKTVHGELASYPSVSEGINAYFTRVNKMWPNAAELLKKNGITADDLNKAFNTGSYEKYPAYMVKTEGSDQDYGKAIANLSGSVLKNLLGSIDIVMSENDAILKEAGALVGKMDKAYVDALESGDFSNYDDLRARFNANSDKFTNAAKQNAELQKIKSELLEHQKKQE